MIYQDICTLQEEILGMLEDKSRYTLYAQGEDERYEIPSSNITIYAEENKLDILFNEKMKPGTYQLIFDWTEPPVELPKNLQERHFP